MKHFLKELAKSYSPILSRVYYVVMNNRVIGNKGNILKKRNTYFKGLRCKIQGRNNEISIGGEYPSVISHCHINVYGSNNKVIIEDGVGLKDLTIYMGGDGNSIHIKRKTQISGKTELAVMEGTKIEIGGDSLFSANITFRAGDSHSVIDAGSGLRINPSKDIIVGDHVWIGNTVIVTKGTVIGRHCVVATGAVLTGKSYPDNCAIGGNPAKVIKEGVSWKA